MADVELARFWRKHGSKLPHAHPVGARTSLDVIAKSEQAERFLRDKIRQWERIVNANPADAESQAMLASYAEMAGDVARAHAHFEAASSVDPKNRRLVHTRALCPRVPTVHVYAHTHAGARAQVPARCAAARLGQECGGTAGATP